MHYDEGTGYHGYNNVGGLLSKSALITLMRRAGINAHSHKDGVRISDKGVIPKPRPWDF